MIYGQIGEAHRIRADYSLGTLGRAPDYMNNNVMAAGMASAYFDQCESSGEIGSGRTLPRTCAITTTTCVTTDLCLTHSLTNPQVNRSKQASEMPDPYIAMGIVRGTEEGVIVRGARMLATLPIADEILIFPSP